AASSDPLVNLPVPPAPAATFAAVAYSGSDPLILSPGTYVGGIWLSGQGPVTLLPGLYYLQGGGFSVSGQASGTGDGVTPYNAPRSKSDAISLTGGAKLHLTPPPSGTYQAITLFQDRTADAPLMVAGDGALDSTGTVYAPRATFTITGNGSVAGLGYPQVVQEYVLADL